MVGFYDKDVDRYTCDTTIDAIWDCDKLFIEDKLAIQARLKSGMDSLYYKYFQMWLEDDTREQILDNIKFFTKFDEKMREDGVIG